MRRRACRLLWQDTQAKAKVPAGSAAPKFPAHRRVRHCGVPAALCGRYRGGGRQPATHLHAAEEARVLAGSAQRPERLLWGAVGHAGHGESCGVAVSLAYQPHAGGGARWGCTIRLGGLGPGHSLGAHAACGGVRGAADGHRLRTHAALEPREVEEGAGVFVQSSPASCCTPFNPCPPTCSH